MIYYFILVIDAISINKILPFIEMKQLFPNILAGIIDDTVIGF